jgi:hypothetical protein
MVPRSLVKVCAIRNRATGEAFDERYASSRERAPAGKFEARSARSPSKTGRTKSRHDAGSKDRGFAACR